jgi:hypothetical protein
LILRLVNLPYANFLYCMYRISCTNSVV